MDKIIINILKKIEKNGFDAYIVGGYVRNKVIGVFSSDIDICTNALPKDIINIFKLDKNTKVHYGCVNIKTKKYNIDITTYRKESDYENHHPKTEYITDLYTDLKRRDFTINSICMDESKEILDFLDGRTDLKKRLINTIGDAKEKFEEDSLRILRAIRFATILDFELSDEVKEAINEKKHLLKELSYNRKKEELDKIFASSYVKKGISLLLEFGLDEELELTRLKDIKNTDSLISVWSILNVGDIYPFTTSEKELIKNINEVMNLNNMDPMTLYKYGLYVNSVAGAIKGLDKKEITESYNNLIIHSRDDINITSQEIMDILDKEPGKYLSDIYNNLEEEILYSRLINTKDNIVKYIENNYKKIEC